ncbi:hypothetical protein ACFV06_17620 [Streptomyces sp. NPDC059618]|uniref:hypothetical protein n=1 Tax=Streptomyces sp. NPDC059618 TaxID=3346887 RepID=UPI0036A1D22A
MGNANGAHAADSASNEALPSIIAVPVEGELFAARIEVVATEVLQRRISERETFRTTQALSAAREMYDNLRAAGLDLRGDTFFDPANSYDMASQITEGILTAAQRQWEEKKIRHLGYALAQIAFHEEIDMRTAAFVVHTAESLSWTQFVLLSLVAENAQNPLPPGEVGRHHGTEWQSWTAHRQLSALWTQWELIGAEPRETPNMKLKVPNSSLPEFRLGAGGYLLNELLRLEDISESDKAPVREALRAELK